MKKKSLKYIITAIALLAVIFTGLVLLKKSGDSRNFCA